MPTQPLPTGGSDEVPRLVALFVQLKGLSEEAVQRAQLVATQSVSTSSEQPAMPTRDVAGKSFFDRQGDEVSSEMRKKRAKELHKLQKKEQKRLRSLPNAGAIDLDALFADQVAHVEVEPQWGGATPGEASAGATPHPTDRPVSPDASSVTSSPEPSRGSSRGSEEAVASTGATVNAQDTSTADTAAATTNTRAVSASAPVANEGQFLRLTPTRYVFTSADLEALHTSLYTLVDITHPTVLSAPDAPSQTLQALRRIVHDTLEENEEAAASSSLTILEGTLQALQPVVLDDVTCAMYVSALLANLSAVPDPIMRQGLPVATMWRTTLLAAQRYKSAKRTLHFLMTVLSNLAYAGRYVTAAAAPTSSVSGEKTAVTASSMETVKTTMPVSLLPRNVLSHTDCELIFQLGIPYYTEAAVVEAWFVMLCNLTAVHPEVIPAFVDLGLVAVVERLLLYHGRQPRVVVHGLQLLTNLSLAVVDVPPTQQPAGGQ